ncbi:threonine/serine dehydratase [Mesorhizobium sp. CA13]|uniref:threonine ammonia-lyase n=1 Tax=unclassified Mesorhizobium TaxID=325217 RepID=UPI00112B5E8D|nr:MULTISPECIES: threonine/serine dehydratase [unclassified Mesorhizobium]MBZ9856475.1 threonine/serine dehydratase [Mesorhizobium sp. CA13]MBZ9921143.1 threonine/serine dehydratase [Mesorhizobium sp. BR1-1-7]MCA0011895.1 threonine/serine dehydratase [Mesorhizobium sp. B294B1A1]MCA0038149.1 threonine/serine dehydratase [Mesorhizobium sp. B292B1B]TPM44116.1 threonine/serine dehydratase [Mesorhizobium sp. B2-3-2]
MISLEDIRAAAARIEGNVRHTPMIAAGNLKTPLAGGVNLMLKLELLQVTGSFKARGATNRLLSLDPAGLEHGIVTASGGNHGIATARAGFMAGVPTTIFLPTNASPAKIEKLRAWGAATRIVGSAWHESNEAAQAFVSETGAVYFHPFADPAVVAGQGTVGLEILDQMPDVTTVLVAMGGGGLVSGVATAIKALAPHVRIVGIEATGSPVLLRALEAGRNMALDKVTTSVATMACAKTDDRIFDIVRDKVDEIVLVDDDEMLRAAKNLWFEMGLAADLSGAAAMAALAEHRVRLNQGERICVIVCGAGPDAIIQVS